MSGCFRLFRGDRFVLTLMLRSLHSLTRPASASWPSCRPRERHCAGRRPSCSTRSSTSRGIWRDAAGGGRAWRGCRRTVRSRGTPPAVFRTRPRSSRLWWVECEVRREVGSSDQLVFQANMKSTADHLVRGIMDLRKKIHIVQDKLEHEVAVRFE